MTHPHARWRILVTPPMSGALNMAVDEALLENINHDQAKPLLRLYAWDPACLSIGYAQSFLDIDQIKLNNLGWDWVRRPTGGRAILHTDELTYSVIAPLTEPRVAGSVLESYLRLSKALLSAMHILNIPAVAHPTSPTGNPQAYGAVCFDLPSNYEIVVKGKKLIGSAQARRRNGVLQHGTLPLCGDLTRITNVLNYPYENKREEATIRLLSHATTVEAVLGYQVSWQTAAQAFITAFQSELDVEFVQENLSDQEMKQANRLIVEKYNHPTWLERR